VIADAPQPPARELAETLLAETLVSPPPLVARLIATAFAERLMESQNAGGFMQLVSWTESACDRYGDFPAIATLLRSACGVALRVVRSRDAAGLALERDLARLDASIALRLDRAARPATPACPIAGDGLDATIAAFLVRLDDTDPLSAEHSRAVSLWCRRLGRRLGLTEEDCVFVARGGMLHDVGKTTTPKEILLAPRSLSDAEFAIMRDHAAAGEAMIAEIERLHPFRPLVRHHHERLDGKGYPDRLAASEIPLSVRIVTVADCFNAMIGRRPYRLPLSPAAALDQLVKNRGTQFDALVVEAMIDIVEHPDD
jgi:HD-GYP domain-containing protein (c-di-GMP phosphodiesterase class II)